MTNANYKTINSTKTMNFANTKAATRSYKVSARKDNKVMVDIKVRGKVVGTIVCTNENGSLLHNSTATFTNALKPIDIAESLMLAKRALKLA